MINHQHNIRLYRGMVCLLTVFLLLLPAIATAGGLKALIVSGINRDPEQIRDKDRAAMRLRSLLVEELGVPENDVTLLAAPDSLVSDPDGVSTAEAIQQAVRLLAIGGDEKTRYLIYYVGQANLVDKQLRLNLPGPDITHVELTAWLKPFPASRTVVVLDCPGAGTAAKPMQEHGHLLIFGARSDQPHSTSFSNYFIPALCNPEADFDGNEYTSLLESFQWAVQQVDERYREGGYMKNETALIEDDGDGVPSQFPWNYAQSGKDGERAAMFFLEEDGPTELETENGGDEQ